MKTTRTLERGLVILETLAGVDGGRLSLTEIAEAVELDKATATRLLHTLVECGFVVKDDERRYAVSSKLQHLAARVRSDQDLVSIARPHLEELRERTDETVHLGKLVGDRVVYIDKLETTRSIRLVSAVGQTMPLHCTGLGKAILSALPKEDADDLMLSLDLTPRQPRSIRTVDALRLEIETTRARGYAVDDRENEENVVCVAAPVLVRGTVLGALSLSGPAFRIESLMEDLGEQVRRTAEAISKDADVLLDSEREL